MILVHGAQRGPAIPSSAAFRSCSDDGEASCRRNVKSAWTRCARGMSIREEISACSNNRCICRLARPAASTPIQSAVNARTLAKIPRFHAIVNGVRVNHVKEAGRVSVAETLSFFPLIRIRYLLAVAPNLGLLWLEIRPLSDLHTFSLCSSSFFAVRLPFALAISYCIGQFGVWKEE